MRRIVALVVLAGLLACVPAAGEAELPTLDVAIVLSSWTLMPEDMPFFAEAAAEVGVKIRWHVYSYTSWSEQKSMILSADNRPDVFINCLTLADVATYRDQLAPLDDLIEQYAPNIRKAYAEDEAMRGRQHLRPCPAPPLPPQHLAQVDHQQNVARPPGAGGADHLRGA